MRMRALAEHFMRDTLQLGTASNGGFGSGATVQSWTYNTTATVKCTVDTSKSNQVQDGTQTTITDAVIYVPCDTSITAESRVKVTHRHRVALATPEYYAVIGAPKDAPNSMVLNCKRLTGNSTT